MINRMYVIILLSVLPLTACGSAQGGEKTEAPEVKAKTIDNKSNKKKQK